MESDDRNERQSSAPPPRRLRLRQLLFALLLLPSVPPLLFSSMHLISANRELLKSQQYELLTHSAQEFVDRLSEDLALRRVQLTQLGKGIVAAPGSTSVEQRLREPWVTELLADFAQRQSDVLAVNALTEDRRGLRSGGVANENVDQALAESFDMALRTGAPAYRFTALSADLEPAVAMSVPVAARLGPSANGASEAAGDDSADQPVPEILVLQAVVPLALRANTLVDRERFDQDEFLLIDATGNLLWTAGRDQQLELALLESDLVSDFVRMPFSVTREYRPEVGGKARPTLARVIKVRETGWGVVAHKSSAVAFQQIREMVWNIVLLSALAIVLALFFALLATRWFSQPIQRMAETSHEIAAGVFDRRVPTQGLMTVELADLAGDFNRMSDTVERYIEQLRQAAQANRALFLNSIRAFAAAIDAKDPYTRGHSERVAGYSRLIARYLGLPKDVQERVWLSAVLHDIGKIGVQDKVLQKHGVLTPEEFEQMKLHPSIGADIVEPITALSDMIPGIRWHHEAWNGTGYPDRLKGEAIPLMARIIGVADTFDAITTSRPYQAASTPDYAIETIKKLTGTKFDAKVVTAFLLAWDAGQVQLAQEQAVKTAERLGTPVPPPAA